MKCQSCSNPATVHLTDIVAGQKKELHLCQACAEQEQFISRVSLIVTMGVAALVLMFFYGFLPKLIAIFAVPGVLVASYYAGTKIVAPIITAQYDQYLNKEF